MLQTKGLYKGHLCQALGRSPAQAVLTGEQGLEQPPGAQPEFVQGATAEKAGELT
jgi:hypothetical protein